MANKAEPIAVRAAVLSAKTTDGTPMFCLCGCGTKLVADSQGRMWRYVLNHGHRGRKHSEDWKTKQSAGVKRAWQDPDKMQALRHQSPELIEKRVAQLRGVNRPPEVGQRISKALTGKTLTPEHREQTLKNLRTPRALKNQWTARPILSHEANMRRCKSISKARTGTHGFGRGARDRLDHFNALHWIIRDNRGIIHEFDNLQSWARANEWRFLPDDRPQSKLKLWERAVSGFNGMQRTDGKGLHQWKGWTLVSVMERKEQGAPDLLGRGVQAIAAGERLPATTT